MEGTRTWIVALIALIVGAVIGYVYMQSQTGDLTQQVTTLQSQLAEANDKAQSAASEVEALKADVDAKTKLVEQQQARITELEATSQQPAAPAAQ
ncbi:MAG: hypothetical protein Q8P46_15315 [Hyphomicrobiales bacterium]|nr:hypothetical protein [Hyphomicrobiales bacterium]